MAIDARVIGERIADARGRRGLTQAQLASAAALDRTALAKIETGARRVAALELARIADALDERIEWFVTEAPAAIVSHRNVMEPGAPSPFIDALVERIARNVEFVAQHDDQLSVTGPPARHRPGNMDEAEQSAAWARSLLGLDETSPCVDMSSCVGQLGLLVFSFDMSADSADAASMLLTQGGVALLNGNLHIGRRRLALAHELAHYLFADEYTVDWKVALGEGDNVWESRLDRFSRALLLPVQGITTTWQGLMSRHGDLRISAVIAGSMYRVDMSTLARRLTELQLISQVDAARVRSVRTTRADIVEYSLIPADELAAPALPRAYEQAVLRLYRTETITSARAIDLLFGVWCEADLPSLPQLPESAIWTFVS